MIAQTRREITELLGRHGVSPNRRLGQHFLADANITRKIVELSGVGPGRPAIEVGAGTGTLTRALAGTGARVIAFEIDARLAPLLDEVTEGLDVELCFQDVMEADLQTRVGPGDWALVANLPYNVGTPLVLDMLRFVPSVTRFVVMMQREVAERLVAAPRSPGYGLPSVVVALHARARVEFRVPPQVFVPPPRVESAVVVMDRIPAPAKSERAIEIAAAAFGQRRKMLRRSLAGTLVDPAVVLAASGIDPTKRAEDLSAGEYLGLAAR